MSTHTPTTPLPPAQIERNFREIAPALTAAEALFEANRCLYCFDAPCMHACPTHIDVPAFIKKIATGNLTGSARVIFDANPIGATCAHVCPVDVLCEGACVEKTLLQKPIEIGRLQRHATDSALSRGRDVLKAGTPNGKTVGVVGSGPAGLSCATYLARLGYAVTIYERKNLAGGLDTYGMAEYKMTQRVSQEEVAQVARLGVEIKTGTEIGRDLSPDDLLARHDALFLGVGLGPTRRLDIPGEDLAGVCDALDYIERIKTRDWASVPHGRTVAVVGAGNTAIDAVTQARRLGAERVLLVYRRTQHEMSAYEYEFELAKQDAVEFWWQTAPVAILNNESGDARLTLRCVRTKLSEADEAGRRSALVVEGSEFEIPVDLVIKATGQEKLRDWLTKAAGVECDPAGRVVVRKETMQTSHPKIFAGGDCVNGGREAVDAAQMGKLAAQGIHEKLSGERVEFAGARVTLPESTGQIHAA